jgi:glycosyltransferase involved in cell wall biosynthesis
VIDVAVVIAARDPGPFLVETLASLRDQTAPPRAIVVVDDGSSDDTVERAVADHPGVVLLRQPPTGRSVARNRGADATDSEALLFLDADDRLTPPALEVLGLVLEADPALEMVHGRTLEFADEQMPPGDGARAPAGVVAVRLGGATLLRRSLWQRVGPLDHSLPRGEWIEWMHRAYQLGARVAEIEDVVLERRLHSANRTSADGGREHYVQVARAALARRRTATDSPPTP